MGIFYPRFSSAFGVFGLFESLVGSERFDFVFFVEGDIETDKGEFAAHRGR
jgi:hypothetical protein